MTPQDIQRRLAEANAVHTGTGEGPDGPPPGQYMLRLRSSIFRESDSDGKYRIRWTWVVLDGEYQGEEVSDMSSLESPKKGPHRMLKQRVRALGLEPPVNIWDYQELCPVMTQRAPIVLGQITHSGAFANVRIIELLQPVGNTAAAGATPPAPVAPQATAQMPPPPLPAVPSPVPAAGIGVGDTVSGVDPDDGAAYTGIVDEITPTGVTVGFPEVNEEIRDVPPTSLTVVSKAVVVPPAPTALPVVPTVPTVQAPPAAPTPAPAASPLREQLVTLATSFGEQVNDLMTEAEIIDGLKKAEWHLGGETGVNPQEAALLQSVGIPVLPPEPPAAPTPPAPPTPAPAPAKPKRASRKKAKKKTKRKKRS